MVIRRSRNSARSTQRGFTLMEMLLVLAIMVAIAAVVMPAFSGMLSGQRLQKSAESVRTEWVKARVRAMKTGRVQVFRFQIGENLYSVQPWYSEDDYLEADLVSLQTGQAGANSTYVDPVPVQPKQLAEGVIFSSGEIAAEVRSLEFEDPLAPTGAVEGQWSAPILFYPDGTTSTARLFLINQQHRYVEIELRGLTGIARISDSLVAEDVFQ